MRNLRAQKRQPRRRRIAIEHAKKRALHRFVLQLQGAALKDERHIVRPVRPKAGQE
jgi:hypothetical protein